MIQSAKLVTIQILVANVKVRTEKEANVSARKVISPKMVL